AKPEDSSAFIVYDNHEHHYAWRKDLYFDAIGFFGEYFASFELASASATTTKRYLAPSKVAPTLNERQASNDQRSHAYAQSATVSSPPHTQAGTYSDQNMYYQTQPMGPTSPPVSQTHPPRFSSMANHQSLPPLQTNISTTSTPAGPRPYNTTTNPDTDVRTVRRSQIESSGTPRAESATIGTAPGMPDPEAARKYRRSQIESGVGTPKADSAGAPEVVASGGGGGGGGDNRGIGGEREKKTDASRSSSKGRKSEDEPIVMTATSFPGQEWQPSHGGWDEY
ncbi:MAG: hypothetical protein Q9180_006450, partial [Flavoplaca navasiana]